jgi:hypothetical protein
MIRNNVNLDGDNGCFVNATDMLQKYLVFSASQKPMIEPFESKLISYPGLYWPVAHSQIRWVAY